jgi:hypothetical protein
LREWLVFDDALREKMLDTPPEKWVTELMRIVPEKGRSMAQSAKLAFDAGLIDMAQYRLVARKMGVEV